jgi:hypothetical protein
MAARLWRLACDSIFSPALTKASKAFSPLLPVELVTLASAPRPASQMARWVSISLNEASRVICTTVLAFLRLWVATCFKVVGSTAVVVLLLAAGVFAGDLAAAVLAAIVFFTLVALAAAAFAIGFAVPVAMRTPD